MPSTFRRLAVSCAFLMAIFAPLALPPAAGAQCAGDCTAELASRPRDVERFAKKRLVALDRCAKRGLPACPATCPAPVGTETSFGLSPACATLVACEVDATIATAHGAAWDAIGLCPLGPTSACGKARGSAATTFTTKRLKRRAASTVDKLPKDRAACVAKVARAGACDADAFCAGSGAWIDGLLPVDLTKDGYQSLAFDAAADGEAIATLTLSTATAGWDQKGRESAVVQYDLDGEPVGTIVVYGGSAPVDYTVMLGAVTAGPHRLGLRHGGKLAPAADAAVAIATAPGIDVIPPGDARFDAVRFAPVLLGFDGRTSALLPSGLPHKGNAISDVPLLTYVTASPGAGLTTYRYTMIWSNEDGGTGQFPDVLLAQWGRTTDIEGIVEVDVTDLGVLATVRFRPDESGTLQTFDGAFQGTHPVVRTATANGLISDVGTSRFRFLLPPFDFDDAGVVRESAMDLLPISYRIMAEEMVREGKTEAAPNTTTKNLSDLRNYLYVDYDIDLDVGGRVLRAVAVVDGVSYASDHFIMAVNPFYIPRVSAGIGRTAIELPPGTTVADVEQLGFVGIGAMNGTLHALDAFMLDPDYVPGAAHLTFSGALVAGGINPAWLVTP